MADTSGRPSLIFEAANLGEVECRMPDSGAHIKTTGERDKRPE